MLTKIRKDVRRGDDGASAVEYGLLVAAIAALIVVVVFALGTLVNKTFNDTCNNIKSKGTSTAGTC
ncbi:MAG: pilus assembly protein Flp/PilA [Actinomycetota bacterium]|jgi:pilus assembly protein Flp/PilA|nr:pilus assembly protein Flp/PilA [Actinomycetota bacterium]MDQ1641896.1 pilus assembly protein Flp/PilA [Actinomycetota bacterium]